MNVAGFLQLITLQKLPSFVIIVAEFRNLNGNFLIQQFVENEKFIHLTYENEKMEKSGKQTRSSVTRKSKIVEMAKFYVGN